ncbi:MAG: TspO/MBR family protein [Pseudomonadota bacterium]
MTLSPARRALIGSIVVLIIGLGISGVVQTGDGDWYRRLAKADLNPPSFVFGIVWPILYLMIGAAGGLIWSAGGRARFWYLLQLALNFTWTPVFFGMQRPDIGLGIVLAMNIAAIMATLYMGRIRALAAWLMVPYLVWIAFAAILNLRIWQLNY